MILINPRQVRGLEPVTVQLQSPDINVTEVSIGNIPTEFITKPLPNDTLIAFFLPSDYSFQPVLVRVDGTWSQVSLVLNPETYSL